MEIHGYKSFNGDGTNNAGIVMPPGIYHCDGDIIYQRNGFHFARNLEDTLRYRTIEDGEPLIAEVIGRGTIVESNRYEDIEYYGYYGLYAASDMEIVRYLTHEEIVEYALKLVDRDGIKRILASQILTEEDIKMIVKENSTYENYLNYYPKVYIKR